MSTRTRTRPAAPVITIETVTPRQAATWLETANFMNRNLSAARVAKIAQQIRDGQWRLNGQTIGFDTDNKITDGQKRLAAIKAAGIPVQVAIVRGLEPAVRTTIDDTQPRRFADDLKMNGIGCGGQVEALLRKIVLWGRNAGVMDRHKVAISRTLLAEIYPQHAGAINTALNLPGMPAVKKRRAMGLGAAAFLVWLLHCHTHSDAAIVSKYLSILAIGSQDSGDAPVVRLRGTLDRERATTNGTGRLPAEREIYYGLLGWNAWAGGKTGFTRFMIPEGGLRNPFPKPLTVKVTEDAP